jgi:Uma2 family endonuclease
MKRMPKQQTIEDDPMATAEALMTANEFGERPDPGYPEELVQGRVVEMPPPDRRHGYVCGQAYYLLRQFIEQHDLGRVMCNDSGVITERNPDTVRGADVAYYSYARLPKGPLPTGYGPEVPELVVEVCSASDRWVDIHEKVAEYLRAGVLIVVVLDPKPQTAHLFSGDGAPRMLGVEAELELPGLLEGFRVRVGRFFE